MWHNCVYYIHKYYVNIQYKNKYFLFSYHLILFVFSHVHSKYHAMYLPTHAYNICIILLLRVDLKFEMNCESAPLGSRAACVWVFTYTWKYTRRCVYIYFRGEMDAFIFVLAKVSIRSFFSPFTVIYIYIYYAQPNITKKKKKQYLKNVRDITI